MIVNKAKSENDHDHKISILMMQQLKNLHIGYIQGNDAVCIKTDMGRGRFYADSAPLLGVMRSCIYKDKASINF